MNLGYGWDDGLIVITFFGPIKDMKDINQLHSSSIHIPKYDELDKQRLSVPYSSSAMIRWSLRLYIPMICGD